MQVAIFPAKITFDVQHVNFFIDDADTSLHAVVGDRNFIVEWFDGDRDLGGTFFINIDTEIDVFKLKASFETHGALRDSSAIEENR